LGRVPLPAAQFQFQSREIGDRILQPFHRTFDSVIGNIRISRMWAFQHPGRGGNSVGGFHRLAPTSNSDRISVRIRQNTEAGSEVVGDSALAPVS